MFLRGSSRLTHVHSHVERNFEDVPRPDGQSLLAAICSGLFAAWAISVAPSLPAVVPIGVQAVLLAFRTGLYVHKLATRMFPASESLDKFWTYVFPGQEEEALTERLAAAQDQLV